MCINTRAVESLSISIALSKRSSLRVREAVRCWWESLSLSRFRISVGWPFCLQPSHRISDVYSRVLADRAVPSVPYFRYFESLPASSRIQLPRRQISPQSRNLFRLERTHRLESFVSKSFGFDRIVSTTFSTASSRKLLDSIRYYIERKLSSI